MRVASIDIGTNTVLLLVAERSAAGELVAVHEEATITRLGEGVDVARKLKPEAIARTSACLVRYAEIVRDLGVARTGVVGTSAMRDAGGGDEVRAKVRELLGVEARTISGDEEARLTFRGALSGLDVSGGVVVYDIGGGSTEVVGGTCSAGAAAGFTYAHSFDVGSVRLTERHVHTDPPSAEELAALSRAAREAFAGLPSLKSDGLPVGIAGTVTTLAAVALRMETYDGARVHGHTMTRDELERVVRDLAALPLARRREVPGLEPKRADVIVAGGMVALAVLDALGASATRVSDRGVRWGLAEELCGA